jgi:colicin import membrane protein
MDAKNLFKFFPSVDTCFECTDGECFLDEISCQQHSEHFNREYKQIDRDFNFVESETSDTGISATQILQMAENAPESKEERKVRLDAAKAKIQAENQADAAKAQAEEQAKAEALKAQAEEQAKAEALKAQAEEQAKAEAAKAEVVEPVVIALSE